MTSLMKRAQGSALPRLTKRRLDFSPLEALNIIRNVWWGRKLYFQELSGRVCIFGSLLLRSSGLCGQPSKCGLVGLTRLSWAAFRAELFGDPDVGIRLLVSLEIPPFPFLVSFTSPPNVEWIYNGCLRNVNLKKYLHSQCRFKAFVLFPSVTNESV